MTQLLTELGMLIMPHDPAWSSSGTKRRSASSISSESFSSQG